MSTTPPNLYLRRFSAFNDHFDRARGWMIAGIIISFIGFLLPWFKFSERAEWFYGGWSLLTNEEIGGIWWIIAAYVLMAVLIAWKGAPTGTRTVAAVIVILATMVVVSVSTGDALEEVRNIDRLAWSFGLFVMLPGHGILLWGAIYRDIVPLIDDAITDLSIDVTDPKAPKY